MQIYQVKFFKDNYNFKKKSVFLYTLELFNFRLLDYLI